MTPIGEVIAANTTAFSLVMSGRFGDELPVKFGSLVKTETNGLKIFGVVALIEHAPTEPNRKIAPHGKPKDALKREMPQVFELLQTECRALIVGYAHRGALTQSFPPAPPDLHDFAYPTTDDEQEAFFSKPPAFLRMLLNSRDVAPDELIVACLRNHLPRLSRPRLVEIGKELAYLFGDDHRRLESILLRVHE
ncbi:MAG: hypothetical protein NZM06_08455 [Chloroherpetonaceae bacterium]|nr:hypothetical protein [Chloroherpetonaceae bacterium]MDW8437390.1 hypothetical protein [Chloroherpetonaceae bacterium]